MRKIKSHQKYNESQRQKNKKRLKRKLSHKKRLENWKNELKDNFSEIYKNYRLEEVKVKSPENLSLIQEPEKVIDYLEKIENISSERKTVLCDLSDIEGLTSDAIIAIIALSNDPKVKRNGRIVGNVPKNQKLADKFYDSGIFGEQRIKFADGAIRQAHGAIFRKHNTQVKADVASALIKFSTEKLFGEPLKLKGVYTTLIECMNNTINHATLDEDDREVWWATVYFDEERKIAFFNFLDNGVGILESLDLKWHNNIKLKAGLKDNSQILREVLEGKIGSRIGLSYRGKGLPEIYKRFKREQFSRLIIIANNVFADVEKDDFRILNKPFKGTFFHWEISYDKYNELAANDGSHSE